MERRAPNDVKAAYKATRGKFRIATVAAPLTDLQRRQLSAWFTLNRQDPAADWFVRLPRDADASGLHAARVVDLCRRVVRASPDCTLLYEYHSPPAQFRTPLLQSLLNAAPGFRYCQGLRVRDGSHFSALGLAPALLREGGALLYLSDPLHRLTRRPEPLDLHYDYRLFRPRHP